MSAWRRVAARIEAGFEGLKTRLNGYVGRDRPVHITPYRGYGTAQRLYLNGRVLTDKGVRQATAADRVWDNVLSMYRRLQTDETAGAHVQATYQGLTQEVVTDDEGYFAIDLSPARPVTSPPHWHTIILELTDT